MVVFFAGTLFGMAFGLYLWFKFEEKYPERAKKFKEKK